MLLKNVIEEAIIEAGFEFKCFHDPFNVDKCFVFASKNGQEAMIDITGLEQLQNVGVDTIKNLVKNKLNETIKV